MASSPFSPMHRRRGEIMTDTLDDNGVEAIARIIDPHSFMPDNNGDDLIAEMVRQGRELAISKAMFILSHLASSQTAVEPVAMQWRYRLINDDGDAWSSWTHGFPPELSTDVYLVETRALVPLSTLTVADAAREVAEKERDDAQLYGAEIRIRERKAVDEAIHWKDRALRWKDRALAAHDDAIRKAAEAGWNACRKSIYTVCEDVQRQADDTRIKASVGTAAEEQHSKGYHAGTHYAAKSIARGFNSMEATDDSNFSSAILALLSDAPKTGDDNV